MKGFGEKKFIQNNFHLFQPQKIFLYTVHSHVIKYRELNVFCSQEPMKTPLLSFSAVDPTSSACRWRQRIKPLTARWTHEEWSIKYLLMWKTVLWFLTYIFVFKMHRRIWWATWSRRWLETLKVWCWPCWRLLRTSMPVSSGRPYRWDLLSFP